MRAWGRRWLPSLLDLLIVGGMMIYAFAGFHLVPFHGDESSFIYISRDCHRILHDHNLTPILYHAMVSREDAHLAEPQPGATSAMWGPVAQTALRPGWLDSVYPPWPEDFNPADQTIRTMTGAVSGLTIGMALDIAGYTVNDLPGMWGWEMNRPLGGVSLWDANVRAGNKPDEDVLDVARIPSALFLALSVAVVYWITRRTAGTLITGNGKRAAGWVAVLVYATTPAVLMNGRRAMQEGSLLFFSTLMFLIALVVLNEQLRPDVRWRRMLIRYVAFGAVSGIAVASKQLALLLIAPPFLTMVIAPRFRNSESPILRYDRRHVFNMAGIVVMGAVVSIMAQPVWWSVPEITFLLALAVLCFACGAPQVNRAVRMAQGIGIVAIAIVWLNGPRLPLDLLVRPLELYAQRRNIMEGQAAGNGRLDGIGERSQRLAEELFFADEQYYESPTWTDFTVIQGQIDDYERSGLAGRGGGSIRGFALIVCTLMGLWALTHHPDGLLGLTILSWWVLPALLLFGTNILPWQRYYVILQPALAVIAGIGVAWTVQRFKAADPVRKTAFLLERAI